jgi:hypothetical protein
VGNVRAGHQQAILPDDRATIFNGCPMDGCVFAYDRAAFQSNYRMASHFNAIADFHAIPDEHIGSQGGVLINFAPLPIIAVS